MAPTSAANHCSASSLDLVSERDSASSEVVGRHFDGHAIARENSNAKAAHVAAERREDGMTVGQGHAKRRVREYFADRSFELYCFFLCHPIPVAETRGKLRSNPYQMQSALGVSREPMLLPDFLRPC